MRLWLALVALSGVWTHVGTQYVAGLFANPQWAWENLHYIARSIDAVILYAALLFFASRVERRRSWWLWWLAVICVTLAFAQLMAAVCGTAYWAFGGPDDPMVGLCYRVQTWAPIALVAGAAILAGVAWSLNHG